MSTNNLTRRGERSKSSESAEQRFWNRVDKNGPTPDINPALGPCWAWVGGKDSKGYGLFRPSPGRQMYVHRFAFELDNDSLQPGVLVDHVCQNPACVRASHLRTADRSQNATHRSGVNSNSSTGARGVWRRGEKFIAGVRHNGKTIHVGTFDTIAQADIAAGAKRVELFGERAGR